MSDAMILVVNDGSGPEFEQYFSGLDPRVRVIGYPENRGKGHAIKYALNYIVRQEWGGGCVLTADADGQHKLEDILRVLAEAEANPGVLVLGSRTFDTQVPWRSRIGNSVTRGVFRWASGQRIGDTQTGLRAFGLGELLFMASVGGGRYEYEMNVLLEWIRNHKPVREVPIETVYLDAKNSCSHFHALKDSARIYGQILRRSTPLLFALSSFTGFLMDYALFLLLVMAFRASDAVWGIVAANALARAASAVFNYGMNRTVVFKSRNAPIQTGLGYAGLALCILAGNSFILTVFTNALGMPPAPAKILTELSLFIASYFIQKHFIFRPNTNKMKRGFSYGMESDKQQHAAGLK
jgi:putative flippase GtrA